VRQPPREFELQDSLPSQAAGSGETAPVNYAYKASLIAAVAFLWASMSGKS